ncbi:MacS family sensor histidine kinase [Nocardioides sp.]|uniref:MacS family sensor histidine kinase n=1 Tax=Nocardioides sp. TaxID=35761 RepID=UPI0027376351|nr:DUF5931 domain-containing protein [Nocardioides sp.]MDP3893925.1 DUF5931 domain-containing protein [Nocardioides sp.]
MAVEDRLFRALAVLRVVVLLNTVGLTAFRFDNFDHPMAGVVVVAVLAVWSAFTIWAFHGRRSWIPAVLVVDLAMAVGALLVSPVIKGEDMRATIPGFWVMAVVLAWAVHWRWRGGLVAAAFVSAADLLIRPEISQTNYGHIFLLMIGGPIVGYMCGSLQVAAVERDRAERAAAAAEERSRLARAVHDGVLQVLTLVQRRGGEQGGEMAELGRLAAEQEAALRSLIHAQDVLQGPSAPSTLDLAGALERLATRRPPEVRVVTPGMVLELPADVAGELLAVVGECLSNVARHVGEDAVAWVLLEDLRDRVVVTVRDEGPGIPDGRLAEAQSSGRLGVSQSICGRMADLGGSADLTTGAFGTEWELTLPRPAPQL